jgi:hypothetical protein
LVTEEAELIGTAASEHLIVAASAHEDIVEFASPQDVVAITPAQQRSVGVVGCPDVIIA